MTGRATSLLFAGIIVLASGCFFATGLAWDLQSLPGVATVRRGTTERFLLEWVPSRRGPATPTVALGTEPFPGITVTLGEAAPPAALQVAVAVASDAPLADVRLVIHQLSSGEWQGEAYLDLTVTD